MFKQYINGKLVDGKGRVMEVIDPATSEVIDTVGCANAEQTEEALQAAAKAFKIWSKVPVGKRCEWIAKFRAGCVEEFDTLVDLIMKESGRPYDAACGDVNWLLTSLLYYPEEAKRIEGAILPTPAAEVYHVVVREPIGVTVGHLAWNYPLGNASIKLAPALASGCTCIIKPSSETPLATLYLGVIAEKVGLPEGILNILAGPSSEVAATLNKSDIPRMISCIGSYETGLKILQQGATSMKRYSLELGGNAPVVVMPDADLEATAANIVFKKVGFAGQTCVNYNRIYIHESIYEVMCEKIAAELSKVKLGYGKDEGYVMGPVINMEARDRMLDLIDDAVKNGAKLVMGGTVPEEFKKGSFITPAFLRDVTDDMRVSTEE
ncbi:MAG: aldehyde dehydrogenase family protein, partial [Clostridia bacterium]|nr:aldehyde dehydrogenase family protein [Clostridia bacterium]